MLHLNRKTHRRIAGAAAVIALSLTLAACGGNSDDLDNLTVVATTDLTAAASATTTSAVVSLPFVFSSGVSELGTTSATTLTFTGASSTTPAFKIESAAGTATGTTTFGSCIFTVTASSFPSGHPLAVGAVARIDPCGLTVPTTGVPVGTTRELVVQFVLGTLRSVGVQATVTIEPSGTVQLNNTPIGQTSVGGATGATGGGS